MMKLSSFGARLTTGTGILSLMDDLGRAMAEGNGLAMMGGGNPGHIPEIQACFRSRLQELAADEGLVRQLIGVYDTPQGNLRFLEKLAALLRREYGWDLGPENICLTNGSQSAFFILFNIFAGRCDDGSSRYIRLPLAPEYIGYSDLGLQEEFFVAGRPRLELLEDRQFKYRVDFEELHIGPETGAICVSRPTNPTGNVVTDEEVDRLMELARAHQVPLIVDNAYGVPFPGIVYGEATPTWNDQVIMCLSLSKLGLPAVRTGIIVAREEIIRAVSSLNAVMCLAPGSFGAMLVEELVDSGEIIRLGREVVKPFYQRKAELALSAVNRELAGVPYRVHRPEGSMFLWLWFEELPISSLELYHRLKKSGVLVVSGHYFFPGIEAGWKHTRECIRLTYSQDDAEIVRGIRIIGAEMRNVYRRS